MERIHYKFWYWSTDDYLGQRCGRVVCYEFKYYI